VSSSGAWTGSVTGAVGGEVAIAASGLSKRYGRRRGVSDVSFAVAPGEICGLLGPNGAGKTTTIRMLVGLSRPDSGTATLLARPVSLGARVLERVGAVIDGPGLVPHISGRRNLKLLWSAAGKAWPPPGLDAALELAGLGVALDRRVRSYSSGMRQRLMLAQALMGEPDVLILDEPANGLDPGEVRALREHLRELAAAGTAVLISSHLLAEVELLATHVVVLASGQVVRTGPLAQLVSDGSYEFEVDDPRAAERVLAGLDGVEIVEVNSERVSVRAPERAAQELTRLLVTGGVGVRAARAARRLEDAFLGLLEQDDASR
jgi:ABC-2 type transport system ATP-binding protein